MAFVWRIIYELMGDLCRQLSKKTLVTEDEVERAADSFDGGKPLRRSTRGSAR